MWMPMPATHEVVYRVGVGREVYGLLAAVMMFAATVTVLVLARRLAGTRRRPSPGTAKPDSGRQLLRIGLGSLWILDGLLQAQPRLVNDFSVFLRSTAAGQPSWLAGWLGYAARTWSRHPVEWDLAFILIQVGVGIAIVLGTGPLGRIGLVASIGWGLIVFVFGEAFGGFFYSAGALNGTPGAALLYALAAALLLLPDELWFRAGFRRGLEIGWSALFGLWFGLQFAAGDGWWRGGLFKTSAAMAEMPQPAILSGLLRRWVELASVHPIALNAGLCALWLALSVYWARGRVGPAGTGLTALGIGVAWWAGQDFGVLGGWGTDPGTGAILLVLLATVIQNRRAGRLVSRGRGGLPSEALTSERQSRVVSSAMEYNRPW